MNIVVCDDVKTDMALTAKMIHKFFDIKKTPINLVLYKDADSLLDDKNEYDLYFLDIMLGDKNGIEIAKNILIRQGRAIIFLLSMSNEFILDGYKVRAIRYFIKPLIWEEFSHELNEALNFFNLNESFVFIDSNINEKIFLSTILFLEKSGRKVIVHTYTGEYISNRNISDWYGELGEKNFVIPYKGIIVNMGNIKRIEKNILILKNEHEIPISRNYVKSIKESFKEYIIEESRKI